MSDSSPGDINGSVIEATALANPVVRPTARCLAPPGRRLNP